MEPKSCKVSLDINKIELSLAKRTEALEPLSGDCCIYKVPPSMREPNKEKFTPQIVATGPFHHGKVELKSMEQHKCSYLGEFLQQIKMSLREFIEGLKEHENSLRESYVEIDGFSRDEFMEIMAVDGAFVMEFLLRYYYGIWQMNDRIFGRQYLLMDVIRDLLLIENQLPFFYHEHLFSLLTKSYTDVRATLVDIVKHFIRPGIFIWEWPTTNDELTKDREVHHLLHFLIVWLQRSQTMERGKYTSMTTPTISEFHRAGVKFKPSSTNCFSSIKFVDGVLEIPKLILTDGAVRNMQVFEYCHKVEYYVGGLYLHDGCAY